MKKAAVSLLIFLFTVMYCKAQNGQNFANDLTAQTKDLTDIKGSAYAYPEWAKVTVTVEDKTTYTNLEGKYSQYEDKLVVKGKDGQIMDFSKKVKEFTLSFTKNGAEVVVHYANGYHIDGYSSNAYFELLANGKTQLLKKVTKKIQTQTEYGATSSSRSFVSTNRYFIVSGESSFLIMKNSKSVLAALSNKRAEIESYAKAQKLDLKKDEDIVKIINYYNSIN